MRLWGGVRHRCAGKRIWRTNGTRNHQERTLRREGAIPIQKMEGRSPGFAPFDFISLPIQKMEGRSSGFAPFDFISFGRPTISGANAAVLGSSSYRRGLSTDEGVAVLRASSQQTQGLMAVVAIYRTIAFSITLDRGGTRYPSAWLEEFLARFHPLHLRDWSRD
jgi:hypothetical protein